MFQPYAAAYGTFLSITSLFFLGKAMKTNMKCLSQLRTEEVPLMASPPPVRPTLSSQTLLQHPLALQLSWYKSSSAGHPNVYWWLGLFLPRCRACISLCCTWDSSLPSLQPVKVPLQGCPAPGLSASPLSFVLPAELLRRCLPFLQRLPTDEQAKQHQAQY